MNLYEVLKIKNKIYKLLRMIKGTMPLLAIIIITTLTISSSQVAKEDEIVVISRLGKIIKTIEKPGLYFRVPAVNNISIITKKNISFNSSFNEIKTKDNTNLILDYYAIWRIIKPLEFFKTVEDISSAEIRIKSIIDSSLSHIIRKSNYNEINTINDDDTLLSIVNGQLNIYGIKIIDIGIKSTNFLEEEKEQALEVMKQNIEQTLSQNINRSEVEATEIKAEADKKAKLIISKAKIQGEEIKGYANVEAARIYAESYKKDRDFFIFLRTIESYKKTLKNNSTIIIPADSSYTKFLFK